MKRYASHFLFLPGHGYLKQYVVEIGEGQCVSRIFPLTEEVENTEWLPGVIALLTEVETDYPHFDTCCNILIFLVCKKLCGIYHTTYQFGQIRTFH